MPVYSAQPMWWIMDLIVEAVAGAITGTATLGDKVYRCALGRSGIFSQKREGDGATPTGRFPLRQVFYRSDRGTAPATPLPCRALTQQDGWCDDDKDHAYNQLVTLPSTARHEELWRADHLYDLILVLGHNDTPVVPGDGSAVFLHVARDDFGPTEGCVAFAERDLRDILARLTKDDCVSVHLQHR